MASADRISHLKIIKSVETGGELISDIQYTPQQKFADFLMHKFCGLSLI